MRKITLSLFIIFCITATCFAATKPLLIDDFEGVISGGPEGTVDFGAGNGSSVDVAVDKAIKNSGDQSLKAVFDAVSGGYIWIARGFGLDAKNAGWRIMPEDIKWSDYKAISFYLYGSDSKAQVAFDIKDSGNEMWRFMVTDNFKGWKQITCQFSEFFARSDWQPDSADKNSTLDFPLKIFQFEPLPVAKGTLYFDTVELQ